MKLSRPLQSLLWLKSRINFRSLVRVLPSWFPLELVFLPGMLACLCFFFFGFFTGTYVHPSWRLDVLALIALVWWGGMAGSAVFGGRLSQLLDLNTLAIYPVSHTRLFLYSVGSGLLDGPVLPAFAWLWGVFAALLMGEGFFIAVLSLPLGLWIIASGVGVTQIGLLLWQGLFYRSRKAMFLVSFLVPVLLAVFGVFAYMHLIRQIPLVEPLIRPEIGLTSSFYWLPPVAPFEWMRGVLLQDSARIFQASLSLVLWSLILLGLGILGVKLIGRQASGESRKRENFLWILLARVLKKLVGERGLRALILKDLKLLWREPYVRLALFLPLLMGLFMWGLSAIVSHNTPFHSYLLRSWPFWIVGMLTLSASDLFSNLFGLERAGLAQLRILGVSTRKILLSKIAGVWLTVMGFSLLLYFLAWVFGWLTPIALQFLWWEQVLICSALIPAGMFFSLEFPMRMETRAASGIQRESFGRILMMLVTRFFMMMVNFLVLLPMLIFCIWPTFWEWNAWFETMPSGSSSQAVLMQAMTRHMWWSLYAMGPLVISFPWFTQRLEILFPRLMETIARGR